MIRHYFKGYVFVLSQAILGIVNSEASILYNTA